MTEVIRPEFEKREPRRTFSSGKNEKHCPNIFSTLSLSLFKSYNSNRVASNSFLRDVNVDQKLKRGSPYWGNLFRFATRISGVNM